ncbi:MAG: hypothetical protein ACLQM8_01855 [Limisphaerales bacterium]
MGVKRLDVVRPDGFRTRCERLGTLMAWRAGQHGKSALQAARMSLDTAKAILASLDARELLPSVASIVRCPVITEREGKLVVLGKGYHADFGGLIVEGEDAPEVPLAEAREALLWTVSELAWQTPADKSRALAARITPALKLGKLIDGSTPLDVVESDQPQSGKGYSHCVTSSIYGELPHLVQQRNGGVGSTDESFAAALVAGRPFIGLDNVRGRLDTPFVESFITAPDLFAARVPHHSEILVNPHRYILQLTSNGMSSTPDLAARSSIARILKQPGKTFQDAPARIRADQPFLLGCVFALLREWHKAGKPRTGELRHAFRDWCQPLDWIVRNLLGAAPLMDGHERAQERVASPELAWLRAVAVSLEGDDRIGLSLTASELAGQCQGEGIAIPGIRGGTGEDAPMRVIGAIMRRLFTGHERIEIEGFTVTRHDQTYRKPSGDRGTMHGYRFEVL